MEEPGRLAVDELVPVRPVVRPSPRVVVVVDPVPQGVRGADAAAGAGDAELDRLDAAGLGVGPEKRLGAVGGEEVDLAHGAGRAEDDASAGQGGLEEAGQQVVDAV